MPTDTPPKIEPTRPIRPPRREEERARERPKREAPRSRKRLPDPRRRIDEYAAAH
jgi:hypothetical protein